MVLARARREHKLATWFLPATEGPNLAERTLFSFPGRFISARSTFLRCRIALLSVAVAAFCAATRPAAAEVKGAFLFRLMRATGPIATSWARILYDADHSELYVVDSSSGTVSIFNSAGMEVFTFGDDPETGTIYDLALLEDSDIVALAYLNGKFELLRCNFRGELIARIGLEGIPTALARDFAPTAIAYSHGRVFVADENGLKVLVLDASGKYVSSYDLGALLKLNDKERAGASMRGFTVDSSGELLFTIPPLFKAYVLSPGGEVRSFGKRGGRPGQFNITGGIHRDEHGNFLVTDLLRSAVMLFDPEFKFLGEFGYRGSDAEGLIGPLYVTSGDGKVFVSQNASRGISVYRISQP